MNLLAIETSSQACSACLKTNHTLFCETELAPQKHANILLSQIDRLFERSQITPEELDVLAFGEGPGAFTGVRIAAGVIQGLGYGWQTPVVSVSSLEAMAQLALQASGQQECMAFLDARMKEVYVQYCQWIDGKLHSRPAQLVNSETFQEIFASRPVALGVGDIASEFPGIKRLFSQWVDAYPQAEGIVEVAAQRMSSAEMVMEQLPQPIYLRNNVAEKPKANKS